MTKKSLIGCGVVLFSFMTALPVGAQEAATIVMRSGERFSGEVIDLGGSGFAVRVGGQDRQLSPNDVATIEFAGGALPNDAQARVNAGQALVLLRNGQVVEGRLSDIGGTRPLRLTVDTPSGQRDLSSGDVAQVHLHPLNQPVATTGQAAPTSPVIPAGAIAVQANQAWTDTGITVRRGDILVFSATGDINLAAGTTAGVNGNAGATNPSLRYPLQGAPVGALIGRVGNGTPFLIGGNNQPIQMQGAGQLRLGVNDDHHPDNSGAFAVTVQATSVRRR